MPATRIADFPEPDRVEGAPHPRETLRLFGQSEAEAAFLEAFNAGRLHHAWLITGPRGLGKATLAWRIARFLLATPEDDGGMFAPPPPETLDIPADHPVSRRLAALSEPRLYLLRRGLNDRETMVTQDILVGEVRLMKDYFNLTAADGGRRVAIVDAADEMNPQAANALLKLLEEPPEKVTFLLISHQPFGLLPTIRSRCRTLRLRALDSADLTAALQAAGGGADDPVALAELEARVRALIRRGQQPVEPEILLGRLRLDVAGKRGWVDGSPLDLSAREWAALEFLAGRVNRIINKDQFLQVLYSWEEEITPNAIEKFVSRLRSKLEPAGVNIRTVRGLGYYLEKPATKSDGAG